MWKPEHRAAADRRGLRHESDLTDAEWTLVAPLIRPAKRGGRPRTVNVREVLNAVFYVLWTGRQKALRRTRRRAARSGSTWTCGTGTARRGASITLSTSRSERRRGVRRARRRRGGALLREARRSFPFVERIIGDAGYQGRKMEAAVARAGLWELQIVRRRDRHRFVVLPKRWIVERTLAWISRRRRLARDYERHARKAAAFVRLAMIRLMPRRLSSNL